MSQHLDLLAAQSMARERERDLRVKLQQSQAHRDQPLVRPAASGRRSWLQDVLVRTHLRRAATH
jgi:hypothetical protein